MVNNQAVAFPERRKPLLAMQKKENSTIIVVDTCDWVNNSTSFDQVSTKAFSAWMCSGNLSKSSSSEYYHKKSKCLKV
jgi:SET domain-containing protein